MEKIRNFKELRIWQKGIEIVKDIYVLTKKFPKEELYSLTSQMRRSAISIPSNIAEGFKRYHSKEYSQFLHIALGLSGGIRNAIDNYKRIRIYKKRRKIICRYLRKIGSYIKNDFIAFKQVKIT